MHFDSVFLFCFWQNIIYFHNVSEKYSVRLKRDMYESLKFPVKFLKGSCNFFLLSILNPY